MITLAEIKKVADNVSAYNDRVAEEHRIICVSTDSYVFDSFYTLADLISAIKENYPDAKEVDIRKSFKDIDGDRFDIPSAYHLIVKDLGLHTS